MTKRGRFFHQCTNYLASIVGFFQIYTVKVKIKREKERHKKAGRIINIIKILSIGIEFEPRGLMLRVSATWYFTDIEE